MAKLRRPQAPATLRAIFPDLVDWLGSPWTGPPPFTAIQTFRVEEAAQDDHYVIRAELPGLNLEDIEVTVEGRTLTIHAERHQEKDNGPCRSEFRYGSLTRLVRLPAKVDAKDITAYYKKGVLELIVPVHEVKPEGSRVTIEEAD